VQLVFRDERGGGWADSANNSLVTFLPESFRPPQDASAENGGFRLEGVALAPETAAFLEFKKDGYESSTVEVPATGEVRVLLHPKKPRSQEE